MGRSLRAHVDLPFVKEKLVSAGIEPAEACGIFKLMQLENGGKNVPVADVQKACNLFTRPVRSADFVAVRLNQKQMSQDFQFLFKMLDGRLKSIVAAMASMTPTC